MNGNLRSCIKAKLQHCRQRRLVRQFAIYTAFAESAGDHLYRMNYQDFVNKHRTSGADITVAALPAAEKEAQAFGLMKINGNGQITDFSEKPKGDALKAMQVDTTVLGLDAER